MPPHSCTDVYAAAKELSTSLMHLRHEQSAVKRQMNLIDDLIDEHQAKIDALMHLVFDEMGATLKQTELRNDAAQSHTPNKRPRLSVSPPLPPRSTSPPLIQQGHDVHKAPIFGPHSKLSPTPSTSPPLIDQGDINDLPVSDQRFATTPSRSMSKDNGVELNIPITWMKREEPIVTDVQQPNMQQEEAAVATDQTPSTSAAAVPDNQGQTQSQPHQKMTRKSFAKLFQDLAQPAYKDVIAARQIGNDGKAYYGCCQYKFKRADRYKIHVLRRHPIEYLFKCDQCEYVISLRRDMRRHQLHFIHNKPSINK